MTYSQLDILQRIKAILPVRWFGQNTPVLDSVLSSLAAGWASLFDLVNYTKSQTRISTAFDVWLDIVATDYFGDRIRRRSGESDASFRPRILAELLRDRCTRVAIYTLLKDLTGRAPAIFEPTNPGDTGCYGSLATGNIGGIGYCTSGGWGNLNLPFQLFVRAFRPIAMGVAMTNGWGGNLGAYGAGASTYIGLGMDSTQPGDLEVYQNVGRTTAIGTIAWISIQP
jgi:hypothetical protein